MLVMLPLSLLSPLTTPTPPHSAHLLIPRTTNAPPPHPASPSIYVLTDPRTRFEKVEVVYYYGQSSPKLIIKPTTFIVAL